MRQFLPMNAISRLLAMLVLPGLSGCTSLAPFQTVTPGVGEPRAQSANAIQVYGQATTTNNAAMADEQEQPTNPTEDVTQNALPVGTAISPVHPIAICYNRLTASADQVRSTAAGACPGGALSLVAQGWNLNVCPVFTPVRAVFTCTTH